ncbi:hypothetical protein LCGC14_1185360 [marine sediment metagenome]|uniref:Uncharacterized protein n=1 Tax=marine sediment metagenome TaxID=412755 RepID=A0A0F9LKW3_9ZZZZ
MKMLKPIRKAWGGFANGKLDWVFPAPAYAHEDFGPAAIFRTKAEAMRHYEDVRRIEIYPARTKEPTP